MGGWMHEPMDGWMSEWFVYWLLVVWFEAVYTLPCLFVFFNGQTKIGLSNGVSSGITLSPVPTARYIHLACRPLVTCMQNQNRHPYEGHVNVQTKCLRLLTAISGPSTIVHLHLHLFLNREGRWVTIDDFTTSFLHFSLFGTDLWDLANSRPVHSLMFPSQLVFCLPCLLVPFTVPWQMVFGQTWWTRDVSIALQFASLYDGQEVFAWSDCLLDLGTNVLVGNIVFVWDV